MGERGWGHGQENRLFVIAFYPCAQLYRVSVSQAQGKDL